METSLQLLLLLLLLLVVVVVQLVLVMVVVLLPVVMGWMRAEGGQGQDSILGFQWAQTAVS